MASIQKRVTRQRMVILEELRKVNAHPTADEVYNLVRPRLPRISLGTVYRNLDILADEGEVVKLEVAGCSKRFDGVTAPHCHVRCTRCGRITDIMKPVALPTIPTDLLPDFRITAMRLEFDGICAACSASAPKAD